MADKTGSGKSTRGFASMDPERQREIARKGGRSSSGNFAHNKERAAEAGRKGGENSPGNFARNRERAAEAGRKGGRHSPRATQMAEDTHRDERLVAQQARHDNADYAGHTETDPARTGRRSGEA